MAKKSLVMGQRVWIEIYSPFLDEVNVRRTLRECEVVEVNKSSAYIVRVDALEKYKEDPKKYSYLRDRVIQKTYAVANTLPGYHERLWLSEEEYERRILYAEKLKVARSKAHEIVDALPLTFLDEFISKYTKKDNK